MMSDLNNVLSEGQSTLEPYIKYFGTYGTAMKIAIKVVDNFKSIAGLRYYNIDEVFNKVKDESIKVGDIIETGGFLLDYGQIFKPYTQITGMFGKCKKNGEKKIYKDGRFKTQVNMCMEYKVFQPPVQKIPPYGGVGCAFLYDTRFEGFEHKQNPNENERAIKPIVINDYAKPIMFLYDVKKFSKYINKEVHIKTRVIELPQNLVKHINGIFDETIREICSNYIDVYSENKNFICLTALDDQTDILDSYKIDKLSDSILPTYVEAELDEFNKYCPQNVAQKTLQSIIPNLPQKIDPHCPITIGNMVGDKGLPFISTNDINIMFREPNIIGFYTELKIFNNEEYSNKLKEFSELVNNFSIDYKNLMKKEYKIKDSMKLNFLFDYQKQYIFDTRGVLYSKSAKNLAEIDEKDKYIQDWLRKSY